MYDVNIAFSIWGEAISLFLQRFWVIDWYLGEAISFSILVNSGVWHRSVDPRRFGKEHQIGIGKGSALGGVGNIGSHYDYGCGKTPDASP
jgi:hypothetical protein